MIAEHEKEIILQCAKKYNVSYILLFIEETGVKIYG